MENIKTKDQIKAEKAYQQRLSKNRHTYTDDGKVIFFKSLKKRYE